VSKNPQIYFLAAISGLSVAISFCLWVDYHDVISERFVPALVGAFVALIISVVVYPWQKQIDRKAAFRVQQLDALRNYCLEIAECEHRLRQLKSKREPEGFTDHLGEIDRSVELASFRAQLVSSVKTAQLIGDAHHQFRSVMNEIKSSLEEFNSAGSEISKDEFWDVVAAAIERWKCGYLSKLEELANKFRKEEPFLEGEISISDNRSDLQN
jgi:hypothetical protein